MQYRMLRASKIATAWSLKYEDNVLLYIFHVPLHHRQMRDYTSIIFLPTLKSLELAHIVK